MNRNQKIALGCGGAGCLGLIVVAIAGALIYYFVYQSPRYRDSNFNLSTNRNSNTNDNSDVTANANENDNTSSSSNSSSTAASSMSDDDKHKLYQAAIMTGDQELVRRVSVKLGLMDDDFVPRDAYAEFVREHVTWVFSNTDFVQSLNTQEKAREYVNQNFPS